MSKPDPNNPLDSQEAVANTRHSIKLFSQENQNKSTIDPISSAN